MKIQIPTSNDELGLELELCRAGHCILTDDGLILTEREACLRKYHMNYIDDGAMHAEIADPSFRDAA